MFSPPWQSMQIHRGASSQCSHRRRCVFACLGWQIVVALNKIFHKSYLRPIVVWSTGTASTDKLNRTNDCGSASMPRERSTGRILTRSVCFSYHDVIVRNHKICIYSVLDFYLRRRYRIVYIVNIFSIRIFSKMRRDCEMRCMSNYSPVQIHVFREMIILWTFQNDILQILKLLWHWNF